MKKRYYVLLIILVSCLWICGAKISVHAEEQINTEQKDTLLSKFDTLLSEFMSEDDLPDVLIPKDSEINLIYHSGKNSYTSDSMYMMEKYGFGANVYHFEDMQGNVYLYLDIIFSDKANLGSDDRLHISLPAGVFFSDTKVKGRLARLDAEVGWIVMSDFKFIVSKISAKTNTMSIPLHIIQREYGNRLLLSTCVAPIGENVTDFQGITLRWQHEPLNNGISNEVLAPSVTIPENSRDSKKVAVLAIVLTLDVIVAAIVCIKLKQHPKKTDESNTPMIELSKEDTAVLKEKLQNNLKLDNEDMEYLKSIGYFEPKSNYKK